MLSSCVHPSLHRVCCAVRPSALRAPRRGAQITAFDLRGGDLIEYGEGKQLWRVTSCNFSRQAQGRAFTQAELRNLKTGLKKDIRMRTDEPLEKVSLDSPKKLQVLYFDKTNMTLMDPESFEQTELPLAVLGEQALYLSEGMDVRVESYQGQPALISVPSKVTLEVVDVTPMPSGSGKENRDIPALVGLGSGETLKVKVPKFTRVGDKVVVNTEDGQYLGKA